MINIFKQGHVGVFAGLVMGAAGFGTVQADEVTPLHYLNIQTINPQAREEFLVAMRHNATQSRTEAANIVFDVTDAGPGDPTLVLFESWRDKAGYLQHEASAHVAPVIALVPKAFAKAERKYVLKNVDGLPAPERKAISAPSTTQNVVLRLTVKAGTRPQFIEAVEPVITQARKAEGNLVFNLYEDRSNPDSSVVYERWANAAAHEAHLARPYTKRFDVSLNNMTTENPEQLVLRDRILE